MDRIRSGQADREFLEKCFHKLLINFAWWVNKVDREGNNVFEGGFLGLDNITVIDRSEKLPAGAVLEQSDATGWMGMFCLNLMRIALELAKENRVYEALATKFFQHYIYVGAAMKRMGGREYQLWDEEDGFFYDVLRYPDGTLRQVPGALAGRPDPALRGRAARGPMDRALPRSSSRNLDWFLSNKQHIVQDVCYPVQRDGQRVHVLRDRGREPDEGAAAARPAIRRSSSRDYGLRSLSQLPRERIRSGSANREVRYEPAEAESKIKGGNSNWRGPVWFPTTFLMIESLRKLGTAYGPTLTVPASGRTDRRARWRGRARTWPNRMIRIFTRDAQRTPSDLRANREVPGRSRTGAT